MNYIASLESKAKASFSMGMSCLDRVVKSNIAIFGAISYFPFLYPSLGPCDL